MKGESQNHTAQDFLTCGEKKNIQLYSVLLGFPVSDSLMHGRFYAPSSGTSSNRCMPNTDTYSHKRPPLNLQYFPLRKGTVRRIAMALSLLNFVIWDGSASIAACHSSIRPIGSKVKSPAWSCLTSSFANIAMWKRVTSDCIPRKSVFGSRARNHSNSRKKPALHR